MKKSLFVMFAAASCIGFTGNAMAADTPVAYLGSSAGGSAYGSSFSSENARANGGVTGGYDVVSFATQNMNESNSRNSKDNNEISVNDLMSIANGNGCHSQSAGCTAGTWTASSGLFSGKIGDDSGVVSGAIGGESLASVARVGTDMSVATAEHQSAASIATSGAGTTGMAINTGHAVSQYSDLGNGSAITAAF